MNMDINSDSLDSIQSCLKEVQNYLKEFLIREGGDSKGVSTWVQGVVYLNDKQRINGKIQWNTPGLENSDTLTVADYHNKCQEVYEDILDILSDNNVNQVSILSHSNGQEIWEITATTEIRFEVPIKLCEENK